MKFIKRKYIPKKFTTLIYMLLIVIVLILFLGRTIDQLKFNLIQQLFPGFYQHVSNFSLSYLFLTSIGYIWLMAGTRFIYIIILGVIIILLNFIFELWISILNTPDIMDAYYGLVGTLISFLFLLVTKLYGIKMNMGK